MAQGYFNEDTIAAIATSPFAQASIGVIRLSGAQALLIGASLFYTVKEQEPISSGRIKSHYLHRCVLKNSAGKLVDDAMFVWMKGPNSFTGEDVVEIHLHGNPLILRETMEVLTKAGARVALPGEFSFRAFRNGKMDLSQAEAVMDLVASRTEVGKENALNSLLGSTRASIDRLKQEIIHLLAEVEVDIDFSDQGLSVLDIPKWSRSLEEWCEQVEKIRKGFQKSTPLREGIRVALVGSPNSGKSTLFNAILGEDRSIVSDIAGTTRDIVREGFQWGGLLFQVADTAGLHQTEDKIEAEGVLRSLGEVKAAQFLFWVVDCSDQRQARLEPMRERLKEFQTKNPEAWVVLCWNKADLLREPKEELTRVAGVLGVPEVFLSACRKEGLEDLESLVLREAMSRYSEGSDSFPIGRMRHFALLEKAQEAVRAAIQKARGDEVFPDILSSDLRAALAFLGEITGEIGVEAVLSHIFSEFCIGK